MNYEKDASKSLLKDIYGYSYGGIHGFGLADDADENDFLVKVETLKPKWETLCPCFHNWFLTKTNAIFVVSVIESARKNSDVDGLYYNNNVECHHYREKLEQCFQTLSSCDVIDTKINRATTVR